MRQKLMFLFICSLFLYGCTEKKQSILPNQPPEEIKDSLITERFIEQHLLATDGRLQTNMTNRKNEYLSESIGLWMTYLLLKNDYASFDQQVKLLKEHFLTKDYLVIWEIKGNQKATANAFIDDLRIVHALYSASEQWNNAAYADLARKMGKALVKYQVSEQLMVDFIELKSKAQGTDVTLSYFIPGGFEAMHTLHLLPDEVYDTSKNLLVNAPFSTTDLFPKAYHLPSGEYLYDDEVNMIDQFYTGYHRAKWGGDVTALVNFTKEIFSNHDGKIYGRYDHQTKMPIVEFESASVYALAILMFLEIGDEDFANTLYEKMISLRVNDEASPFYGGYIDISSKDTHIFDHLLALIAERTMMDY